MRTNKFARTVIDIASVIVTNVTTRSSAFKKESIVVCFVKPSWKRPRCSKCKEIRPGYDHSSTPVQWVHLNLGSVRFILEYSPRRVECPTCGVRVEQVPWARADSRFTKPFEEMTAYLTQITNKTEVSKIMGISWRTVGNIVRRVVDDKLDPNRLDGLKRIGADEISYRKRHRYITTVVDHDKHRIVWAAKGKDAETLNTFFDELGVERAESLELATIDMSPAFIKSIETNAPHAQIVFDRFHVMNLASDAVDTVRREMVNQLRNSDDPDQAAAIKKSQYALLKRPWNLTIREFGKLCDIQKHNAKLYRAYLLKESLAAVFDETSLASATQDLNRWLAWASRSKLEPFIKAAKTVRKHKDGILAYIETRLTNGIVEGLNNKLRMIMRRAFGFHSADALIAMLFLCCGGIHLSPPLPGSWCDW